ncbi:DUF3306 domain-containing protein [Denitromonas iodatirespirans]|uniref:DUF3306 domain-containing protein n=1 Tax=Denitromonas iodatirespirans TaxID=2795389 RepID=A0A944D8J6_DENI1|nr:DUF3306 domain-containing protein [Denitromonas iodatirespirans]MBT0959897.1 DUF3306 domain-containing protein [Denitromonas iodatirespirans]
MSASDTEPVRPTAAGTEEGGFLRRWSQRKQAAARGDTLPEPVAAPVPPPPADERETPPLPDPAGLTLADDFRGFLRPKVPAALKRQALTQLFSQAHFNQVDGLDVYMDDYNLVPDLNDADRGLLRHARAVLDPTPSETLAERDRARAADALAAADDAAPAQDEAGDDTAPAPDDDPAPDAPSA